MINPWDYFASYPSGAFKYYVSRKILRARYLRASAQATKRAPDDMVYRECSHMTSAAEGGFEMLTIADNGGRGSKPC